MRAAQYILGTIGVLMVLSGGLHYFREKTLAGYNPFPELLIGTVIGLYSYNRKMRKEAYDAENRQGQEGK